MRTSTLILCGVLLSLSSFARAEDSQSAPRPVPLTRPEMKRLLEDMKDRRPRIPLPELTAEEKERAGERGGQGGGYEGRLRSTYMPAGGGGFGSSFGFGRPATPAAAPGGKAEEKPGERPAVPAGGRAGGGPGGAQEPGMTLSYAFKTELFWIVSRTNNCQYCMGHQESKLLGAGLKEEQIAALDSDWTKFAPAEQAAFAYARKFTWQPHLLADADIESLRKHYTDLQILEMTLSMAGNNSINRWKEGVGVPQGRTGGGFRGAAGEAAPAAHSYLTPTPEEFISVITTVAPTEIGKDGKPTTMASAKRPPLESRDEVEKALAACQSRQPRLPLVDEAPAREVLGDIWTEKALPQWVRLLVNFPRDGKSRVQGTLAAEEKGDLKPLLKAQVSWIIARQDRAWYATGLAKKRLAELGQTDDQIYKLDGACKEFTPAEQAMFTLARNLSASPVVLTDDEVDAAVKLSGPRDVVQLISYVTGRAAFDRITEAAGLQLEK